MMREDTASVTIPPETASHGENVPPTIRILFCGIEFSSAAEKTREVFASDPAVEVLEVDRNDVAEHIKEATVVVPKMCRIDREMIASATKLQLINQFGVGLEGVDIEACDKHGIHFTNIPSDGTGNAASVAEHAVYLMIGLLRHQNQMQESMERRILGAPMGRTLMGQTVLLVGFGGIAMELAPRLKAFGVAEIMAVRRGQWGAEGAGPQQIEAEALVDAKGGPEDMHRMLGRADIVVLLCVQTPETIGMVDTGFIAAMKRGGILINVARGRLLEKDAVLEGLQSGQLGGLGADVQWTEPFDPDDPVARHPNVIMTPHVGGVTEMSMTRMACVLAENVRAIAGGRIPLLRKNSVTFGLRYSLSGVILEGPESKKE